MKKTFLFFVLALSISNVFLTQASAQDSNTFLPEATGASNTVLDDTNIYLQGSPQTTDTISEDTTKTEKPTKTRTENGKLSCPYTFERDLQSGSTGEDVKLLQILLNSDKRTMIAVSGPGSLGKETNSFGEATKVAVKKFQALFIEYVGVANGRFGPRTRTVMNAICNGDTSSKKETVYDNVQSVQKDATPKGEITEIPNDKVAPRVSLSANLNTINTGDSFKVVANFSEEVKPITPDSVIVDGGVVKEIRKLSKTSYAIAITPNENIKNIVVQIEADKIEDLASNKNENASNEITVKVKLPETNINNSPDTGSLDNLVNKVVSSAPTCNYDNQGNLITNNPNNGQPLNTTGCNQTKTNYAAYNTQMRCYADNGPLPNGISEAQRCSNPQNPNNPNSPCSSQNQAIFQQQLMSYQQQQQSYYNSGNYGYYGYAPQPPQNPCQNSQIAYGTQQAAQRAAQQNDQASQIGQLLGSLLGKGGFGGLGGNGQNGGGGNGGGGGSGGTQSGTVPTKEQVKQQQIQNDLQALTDQYAEECNTAEKLATKNCKDIEKKVAELNQQYTDSMTEKETQERLNSLENNIDKECDKGPTEKCIQLSKQATNIICNQDQNSQECLAAKRELSEAETEKDKKDQHSNNDLPLKGKVSEDTSTTQKECSYLQDNNKNVQFNAYKVSSILIEDNTNNGKKYILSQQGSGIFNNAILGAVKGENFLENKTLNKIKNSTYKCCKSYKSVSAGRGSSKYICTDDGKYKDLQVYEVDKTLTKKEARIGGN